MPNRATFELDAELASRVDEMAAALGRPRDELIARVLLQWLEGGRLRAILDSIEPPEELTDDEAMAIAIEEQRAYRAERAAAART